MDTEVDLEVKDVPIPKLISRVEEGIFRIPEFQRDFIWDPKDVRKLFDSINKGYPIGSLLLWRSPQDKWGFFRSVEILSEHSIGDQPFPELNFVLDGQQRLLSLYVGLKGLEFEGRDWGRLVLDLNENKFRYAKGESEHLINLHRIWSNKEFKRITKELNEPYEDLVWDAHQRLNDYKIPIIFVETEDMARVRKIFVRVNEQGKKLGRFDIINANVWRAEFNLKRKIEEELFPRLKQVGFGVINKGTVTQTQSLILEGSATVKAQRRMKAEGVKKTWDDIVDAIISAVNYLRHNFGVKQIDFIPYESMLPILSYYMYKKGINTVEDEQDKQIIDKWFWGGAFSRRYSQASTSKMDDDIKLIDRLIDGEEVSINYPHSVIKDTLIQGNIKRSTSAIRNAFLCLLSQNNPLHFENGSQLDLTKREYSRFKLNKHHIFPNAFLKSEGFSTKKRKSLMDITFIPAELNKRLSDASPSEYFSDLKDGDCFNEIMKSHFIPYEEESGIWTDDYELFLQQRAEMIMNKIEALVGESKIRAQFQEDPHKLVEELETQLRDLIDEQLSDEHDGAYWGESVPSDVNSRVIQRVREEEQKLPEFKQKSCREKLDYCNIMDYKKIFHKNWSHFEDIFSSKQELSDRLAKFSDLRNALSHGREVDYFTEQDGKLAIEWFDQCLENV